MHRAFSLLAISIVCILYNNTCIQCRLSDTNGGCLGNSNDRIDFDIAIARVQMFVNRIKFNESTLITCSSRYYYPNMYLARINEMLDFNVNVTNITQIYIRKVRNVYYYQFNYTSIYGEGYISCINMYAGSYPTIVERSKDKQIILHAWRRPFLDHSSLNITNKYEFVLYIKHNFNNAERVLYFLIANNFYDNRKLTHNLVNPTIIFRHYCNLHAFYIRIYVLEKFKKYLDHDMGETYIGYSVVSNYDENVVRRIMTEH